MQVQFQGGYTIYRDGTLITAIKSKIGKRYSLPSGAELWLLTYGLLHFEGPEAIKAASEELSAIAHPFTEVWYALPLPHRKGTILHQVWPIEDSDHDN